jgi:hypothetical protein
MNIGPRRISLFVLCLLISLGAVNSRAQNMIGADDRKPASKSVTPDSEKSRTDAERINSLEESVRQQAAQLDELKKLLLEQQATIKLLAGKLSEPAPTVAAVATDGAGTAGVKATVADSPQTPQVEERFKKVETRVSELGSIKFSGDLRIRAESILGQENTLANASNPTVSGNELTARNRMRIRARLTMRGTIGNDFDWGIRLASGSFADNISTNQTLTDWFNRKPFGLDQAFLTWKPHQVRGLRLQGGKFEMPWLQTEMTFDNDLTVDGFNELYTHTFKKSAVKELTFVAWQLPMLERNAAFVRNANGTVNIAQSRRDGRDLALYGAQLRTRIEPSSKVALTLAIADHHFYGTQFISPVQVFGSTLSLPVVVVIPATATTPAQTVTTQVSIPRDLLVAGNANLGLTNASNNAINPDGRLASGFNLVDLYGRVDLKYNKRFPVGLIFNFVTNTQAHDVIRLGAGGVPEALPNNENKGFWGEVQVGQTKEKGDLLFGYTFVQIDKDAVLTPFNFSDITQQSDSRVHRLVFSYAADPRVVLSVTGIWTQRLNGLFGPFVATPAGSLDRTTTRLQFDTSFRF